MTIILGDLLMTISHLVSLSLVPLVFRGLRPRLLLEVTAHNVRQSLWQSLLLWSSQFIIVFCMCMSSGFSSQGDSPSPV